MGSAAAATNDSVVDDVETTETPPASTQATTETKTAPETKPESTSVATDQSDSTAVAAPADWPVDWRAKLAGDDTKLANRLQRFTSVNDIAKAWVNADALIRSGQVRKPLPENATDEQLQAWRQEAGIPQKWEDYGKDLGDGIVIGDDDKPMADSFMQFAHSENMHPSAVKSALKWYYKFEEETRAAQAAADKADKARGVDELRAEWGAEYRANLNAVKGMLDAEDPELFAQLFGSRDETGAMLGNEPRVLRWLAKMATLLNPAATLVPGHATNSLQSIESEIAEIKKKMGTKDYDDAMRKRYEVLLDAQLKLKQ